MSIAEDIILGFQCSWCGVCFKDEHGYPVLCKDCQKQTTPEEMKKLGLSPAQEDLNLRWED